MKQLLSIALASALAFTVAACSDDDPTENTDTGTDPGDGDGDGDDFAFATDAPSAYARVDRMGMPAVATAVITSKDAYNSADPIDDGDGDFVAEIVANVTALHEALDDDLTGAGLEPCAASDCVDTTAPFVVPDTLQIDPGAPSGFPNGRRLGDPAMDVTLALVLLDVVDGVCGEGACSVTTLASLPLNPSANDLAFSESFPFLPAPHAP